MACLKLYAKVFLYLAVACGLPIGAYFLLLARLLGQAPGMSLFWIVIFPLLVGAVFGAALVVYLVEGHVRSVFRLGFRLTDESLSVVQRRKMRTALPYDTAFTLCLAAVRHLSKTRVEEETDYGAGVILATRGRRLGNPGERLRFTLRDRPGGTEVEVESRPRVWTVMVDDGASIRNLDKIIGFLLATGADEVSGSPERRSEAVTGRAGVKPAAEFQSGG